MARLISKQVFFNNAVEANFLKAVNEVRIPGRSAATRAKPSEIDGRQAELEEENPGVKGLMDFVVFLHFLTRRFPRATEAKIAQFRNTSKACERKFSHHKFLQLPAVGFLPGRFSSSRLQRAAQTPEGFLAFLDGFFRGAVFIELKAILVFKNPGRNWKN